MHVREPGTSNRAKSHAPDEDPAPSLPTSSGGPTTSAESATLASRPSAESAGPGGGSGLTRVTVNLNRQAVQALEIVSEATGYSKTDTINRALQIYAIIQEIMQRNGGVLRIKHDDGALERIHIV
jgi:hypothetical protein